MHLATLPKDPEKSIVKKAEVTRLLRVSLDTVSKVDRTVDRQKRVQFLGRETTADAVFLRILVSCQ